MQTRNCRLRIMEHDPGSDDLRSDTGLQRTGIGFKNILTDLSLCRAVAHSCGISAACQLTDQKRINGIMGKLQCFEIHIVAAGIAGIQKLQFGCFCKDAAAVGTEIADQTVQDFTLVIPGILIDFGNHKRHTEAFNKTEQIFERPILKAVQPGKRADKSAPCRITFFAELMDDKTVFCLFFRHSVGIFIANQLRRKAVAQSKMMRLDTEKSGNISTGSPDDFRSGKGIDHCTCQIADKIIKSIKSIEFTGGAQFFFKSLCGNFVKRSISARLNMPGNTQQRINTLLHCALDIPVAFHDLPAAQAKLFDVSGIGGIKDPFQPCRGIVADRGITVTVRWFRHSKSFSMASCFFVFHFFSPVYRTSLFLFLFQKLPSGKRPPNL